MLASTVFTAWLLPVVSCFTFTSPEAGTALNLSAPNIEIRWDPENTNSTMMNINFRTRLAGDNRATSGSVITSELAVSDMEYMWDPANISEALLDGSTNRDLELGENTEYYLEAVLYSDISRANVSIVESPSYSITEDSLSNAAAALQPHFGLALLTAAALSIGFGI